MPSAPRQVTSPAANVHATQRRPQDSQREIQLSVSDLEILIDNTNPAFGTPARPPRSSQGPSRCPPPKPSSKPPAGHRPVSPPRPAVNEKSSRVVMLGVTVLLWGAMAATAGALRSPTYRGTPGGSIEITSMKSIDAIP